MQKILCEMKFTIMISEDFNNYSYILFCFHETHTYSSFFFNTVSQIIMMKIVEIIQQMKNANLIINKN